MVIALTGSILKKYEYSDYGERNLDSKTEILDNEYGYNGEAHTVDGLQYLRSRYYDPVTGVFISRDSYRGEFSNPLSQNRYTYCHNNPYKYDDPSGHLPASGINKYAANAYMDGGDSTYTPKPLKKPVPLKTSTTNNKPTTQQQNTNYNSGISLRDTSRTPSVKTEAVNFDDGDVSGESDEDDIGDQTVDIEKDSVKTDEVKETEEVTGKEESSNVGTEIDIVTEPYYYSNPFGVEPIQHSSPYDYNFWSVYEQVRSMVPSSVSEALIQDYLADVLMDNIAENVDDIVSDVVGKIVASTAIAIPKYPKTEYVSVFDDIAPKVINSAELYSKQLKAELVKSANKYALYANKAQAATSFGLGVIVSAAYDIVVNKEDISDAVGESVVKTGMTMVATQVFAAVAVGTGFISSVAAAPGVILVLGILGGFVADNIYERNDTGNMIAQGISKVVESIGSVFGYDW